MILQNKANQYKYIYDHFVSCAARNFFRPGLSVGFSELNFSVKSLRSSAVFGGPQTPLALPYPFRTWPGSGTWAERDKREVQILVFWAVYARAILGSWHKQSLNEKNILENIYFQGGIISILVSYVVPTRLFFHGHTSKRLAFCRTTAVSLLFDIGFHG